MHALEPVIARYNDAWNRHDVDAILALHTEDSTFENHTSGGKGVGKDAIGAIVASVFASLPDIHFDSRRLYVRDDLVVQEWTATATKDGKRIAWDGVDVMPFRDGKVLRKDVYADSISFRKQIGQGL